MSKRRKRTVVEAEVIEEETALVLREPELLAPLERISANDLYEMFLRDKSELTAKNYRVDLKHFASFLGAKNVATALHRLLACRDAPEANMMILSFRHHMQGKDGGRRYSNATINRRLAALRSFTKLARMVGKITWTIEIDGVKTKAFRDTTGCGVDGYLLLVKALEAEIAELGLVSLYRTRLRYRDLALLTLMYHAGLRRMEPLTIDFPEHVQLERSRLSIIGKSRDGEREWVPINGDCVNAIMAWIDRRGTWSGPLFVSCRGTRMVPDAVNERLTTLAKKAGLDVNAKPHGLRHAAITEILDQTNGNVRIAQLFARHQSADVTTRYDDNRQNLARQGVEVLQRTKPRQ